MLGLSHSGPASCPLFQPLFWFHVPLALPCSSTTLCTGVGYTASSLSDKYSSLILQNRMNLTRPPSSLTSSSRSCLGCYPSPLPPAPQKKTSTTSLPQSLAHVTGFLRFSIAGLSIPYVFLPHVRENSWKEGPRDHLISFTSCASSRDSEASVEHRLGRPDVHAALLGALYVSSEGMNQYK